MTSNWGQTHYFGQGWVISSPILSGLPGLWDRGWSMWNEPIWVYWSLQHVSLFALFWWLRYKFQLQKPVSKHLLGRVSLCTRQKWLKVWLCLFVQQQFIKQTLLLNFGGNVTNKTSISSNAYKGNRQTLFISHQSYTLWWQNTNST